MPEKTERKESYQPAHQPQPTAPPSGERTLPSQESIDLLTKLLLEFERRTHTPPPSSGQIPPEVERDIEAVNAAVESIEMALSLGSSPIAITALTPNYGAAAGGTSVRITGSHLLPGATVTFGGRPARDVSVVGLGEIRVTTPADPAGCDGRDDGRVDVVVTTVAGAASLPRGYTYQG